MSEITHYPEGPPQHITEADVRAMRDLVFEVPSSHANWEACKEKWMRPDSVRWLRQMIKEGRGQTDP